MQFRRTESFVNEFTLFSFFFWFRRVRPPGGDPNYNFSTQVRNAYVTRMNHGHVTKRFVVVSDMWRAIVSERIIAFLLITRSSCIRTLHTLK